MRHELTCPFCSGNHIGLAAAGHTIGAVVDGMVIARGPSAKNVCQECGYAWSPGDNGAPPYFSANAIASIVLCAVPCAFFLMIAMVSEAFTGVFLTIAAACAVGIVLVFVGSARKRGVWNNRPAAFNREPEIDPVFEDQVPRCLKFPRI